MRTLYTILTLCLVSIQSTGFCQLQDGETAPNWTLTDIDGNSHTLYNYLNQGKMVVLEFSATWCGPCWNYLLNGALEDFWAEHGPDGLDDAMIFHIESDWSTGMNDLLGLTGSSQGNWVANISFPIIDLPSGNTTASQGYEINYYPTLYAVCHDATIYELGPASANTWENFIQSCNMEVEVADLEPALCVGEGSVTVEGVGGFSPYSYYWNIPANTATISGLNSGNYHVTVTEAYGKISTLDVFVPGASQPVSIADASIEPVLCFGTSSGNVYIESEGGVGGYQYDWSNGATTQNLLNVPADLYTVTVTDFNGCSMQQSFFVNEPDMLEAEYESTPDNCDQSDGTITVFISGGAGNYQLTANEGTVVGNQVLNLPAGDVEIQVEDQNGCIWSDEVTIEFVDAPQLEVTQGAELNCIQSTTSVTGFPTGGFNQFSYHWTTANGHIISNPLVASITVDAPGTYLLQVTDIVSGCQASETATVVSEIVPPNVDAGHDVPINCENLQVTLNGTGDSLNIISWTTSNGHIVSGGSTYHPVVDAPGIYYIEVLSSTTNCSNQDSVVITNNSAPAASAFQYITSGLSMSGTDISTGSNISGWNWTFGDGSSSGDPNVVHTYATAGIYQVCLSVQNGCGANQSCQMVEVTSGAGVILVEAVVTNVLCFGNSTGSIVLKVNGGSGNYTYAWTSPDTTYTTPSIDGVPAGPYQVVVSDDLGNIFIGSYNVVQPSILSLTGSMIVDNLCFGDINGFVSVDISGGVQPYLYSWNGLPAQTENFLNQLPGGTVQVIVIDANGCILPAGPYTIAEPEDIKTDSIMVTNASGADHADGAVTIALTGGTPPYLVSWNNGATGTSISGLIPGTYTYTVTDANGCQYSSPEPVIVHFTTAVREATWPEYVSITPNPTKGDARIMWTESPGNDAFISIMSVDGKLIDTHSMSAQQGTWDLGPLGLSSGLYLVLLRKDNQVFPFKLIVMGNN